MKFILPLSAPEASDANCVGPKAANLAALGRAGLPIPDGFCLSADAYRMQIAALGLEQAARGVFSSDGPQARRYALDIKLAFADKPITPAVVEPLLGSWRALVEKTSCLTVVRSSALVEDRFGSSFAGQFETFLGLESETDFITAIRSCWGALWMTRALRYMATHAIDPADTAM